MQPNPSTEAIPSTPGAHPWLAALGRSRWLYVALSPLLLLPCFWQARLQAGDLSSHVYNAWLAQRIESEHLQGLAVAGQTTNILFDMMLGALLRISGAEAAQRISVSLTVLVFIWGAFAFARAVSGRKPWHLLPCIAMLAYGWVFHMGFFNFYLSLGLVFWTLALLWTRSPGRIAAAAPVLLLAYAAHALPVLWGCGLAAYALAASRVPPKFRVYTLAATAAAMLILRTLMTVTMTSRWSPLQITFLTGLDQMWVFDREYFVVVAGLTLVWGSMFFHLIHRNADKLSGIAFHLCLVSAASVAIFPTEVLIPGQNSPLAFIAERMSLGVGICVCAMLAAECPRKLERYGLIVVTLVFFALLYRDERTLNSFEDRLQSAVAGLPQGQRVISAIDDPSLRVFAVEHMIDRVCVGHCFSYGNYEPSTGQFRVRATAENPYVAFAYRDAWLLKLGLYVVKKRDLPLYELDLDASGEIVVKSLRAEEQSGSTPIQVLGDFM